MKVRSVVGLLPLVATTSVSAEAMDAVPELRKRVNWFFENQTDKADLLMGCVDMNKSHRLLTMMTFEQRPRVLERMLDEGEFLSTTPARAVPGAQGPAVRLNVNGTDYSVSYEPGESHTTMFGATATGAGRSGSGELPAHRRPGPAPGLLRRPHHAAVPDRLGQPGDVRRDRRRPGAPAGRGVPERRGGAPAGVRDVKLFQEDEAWHDQIPFHEYFHGDTGAGIGLRTRRDDGAGDQPAAAQGRPRRTAEMDPLEDEVASREE